MAGIGIGEQIHKKHFSTAVHDNLVCNSSCANIWLAGLSRTLGAGASVGFHVPYLANDAGAPTAWRR